MTTPACATGALTELKLERPKENSTDSPRENTLLTDTRCHFQVQSSHSSDTDDVRSDLVTGLTS